MFTRLLESYPHSRSLIMAEAVVDVCPLVRAEVWAALLGVKVRLLPTHTTQHTHILIMAEAVVDVCPLVRAEVWAALLGVKVHLLPTHTTQHTHIPISVLWSGLRSGPLC